MLYAVVAGVVGVALVAGFGAAEPILYDLMLQAADALGVRGI